jgi:hypothetical protein
MIGGPPKQPERHTSQEIQDFIIYVSILPLTEGEKRLLMSIVAEKQLGQLTIFVDNAVSREVVIDPTKTDKELTRELSTVFDNIYEEVFDKSEDEALPPWDENLKMSISFAPLTPGQLQ